MLLEQITGLPGTSEHYLHRDASHQSEDAMHVHEAVKIWIDYLRDQMNSDGVTKTQIKSIFETVVQRLVNALQPNSSDPLVVETDRSHASVLSQPKITRAIAQELLRLRDLRKSSLDSAQL